MMSGNSAMSVPQPLNIPTGDKSYRLVADYTYEWVKAGVRRRITVPEGFDYDGASVPRFAWSICGLHPDGLIRAAACIHDWLYEHKGELPYDSYQRLRWPDVWENVPKVWTRRNADRMFGRIMRESGIRKIRRRVAYLAVRGFGWTMGKWTPADGGS